MGYLTPEFLFDFESRMRVITENEYARLSSNLWWSKFARVMPSQSKRELVTWLLSTAQIVDGGQGGNMIFDDIVSKYTEYTSKFARAGLKLSRPQLEDLDGGGLDIGAKWSADIGAQMAYWPQKKIVELIKNGHLTTGPGGAAYDGLAFFSNAHLIHPGDASVGTFANLFTGVASSTPSTDPNDAGYPGACPIDDSVDLDDAFTNLSKVVAYIKSIKMPNGEDPRFLRPVGILAPPRMQQRVAQLTNAKFIAQVAGSGAGSADVEALVASFGFTTPTIADELAGFESDTTWFLACQELSSSQLGAFLYIDREPFKITYYTGQGGGTGVDAVLDRADELEWHCKGRNGVGYGHPYTFFKIKAT